MSPLQATYPCLWRPPCPCRCPRLRQPRRLLHRPARFSQVHAISQLVVSQLALAPALYGGGGGQCPGRLFFASKHSACMSHYSRARARVVGRRFAHGMQCPLCALALCCARASSSHAVGGSVSGRVRRGVALPGVGPCAGQRAPGVRGVRAPAAAVAVRVWAGIFVCVWAACAWAHVGHDKLPRPLCFCVTLLVCTQCGIVPARVFRSVARGNRVHVFASTPSCLAQEECASFASLLAV